MILCMLFTLFSGTSGDSLAISQARASLEIGDTLGAIEILQDWSSDHRAGRELTNLLGALHMPDEPIEPSPDTVAASLAQPVQRAPSRVWSFRGDEVLTSTSLLSWSIGAGVTTRLGEFGLFGRPVVMEGGVAGAVWNDYDDALRGAFEPMATLSVATARWDARVHAWAGYLGDGVDAGGMATFSRSWSDSVGGRIQVGTSIRAGTASSSFVGGFCQLEKKRGRWSGILRTDIRLRHDRFDPDSTSIDSLRMRIQGDRVQSITRLQSLWSIGQWLVGPAVDVDLRSSLASDSWSEGGTRRSGLRQEGIAGASLLGRFTTKTNRWIQSRLGWSVGFSDAAIDPGFSERNSGLASSISVGGSF